MLVGCNTCHTSDVSIAEKEKRRQHITGGVRMTNVGDNSELVIRKVAPALEVITHGGLNGKLGFGEFIALEITLDFLILEYFLNHNATFTTFLAAILVTFHRHESFAKVIPRNLVHYFALGSLRNNAQAENNILLGNGGDRKFDKIDGLVTKFTGDVAIQLKYPPGYDGAEGVAEHPNGTKGNAHHIMFGGDLTAKHNKIIETEMVRILSIVVLPQ